MKVVVEGDGTKCLTDLAQFFEVAHMRKRLEELRNARDVAQADASALRVHRDALAGSLEKAKERIENLEERLAQSKKRERR